MAHWNAVFRGAVFLLMFVAGTIGKSDDLESRITDFVVKTARPNSGVSRAWTHSGCCFAVHALLTSEKSRESLELTEEQYVALQSVPALESSGLDSDCDGVLSVLTSDQRRVFEGAVLLMDGFERLSSKWWVETVQLPPERLDAIEELRRELKKTIIAPLHSSVYVGGEPRKITALVTEVTVKANILFGIGVLRLLTEDERKRLLQQIEQIDMNHQVFCDARKLAASVSILPD